MRTSFPAGRFRRTAAGTLGAAMLLLSGCAHDPEGTPPAATEPPAGTTEPAETQYFGNGEHVGETATITAEVEVDLTDESVVLDAADYGDDSLLVLFEGDRQEFGEDETLTVEGTVQRFSYDEYSETYGLAESALYEVYAEETFLLAASVTKPTR